MTTQVRNDDMVKLLQPNYFSKNEPNSSWVHYQSAIMQLCGLRGYYPMGAQRVTSNGTFAVDTACGYDLSYSGLTYPQSGYLVSASLTGLPPFLLFTSASAQYLTYGMDDRQHDIAGTETSISTNERGLTLCGWFKFTTVPASVFGLISKWEQTIGNQRSYELIKTAANTISFVVSSNGAATTTVTSTATVTTGVWYYLWGRFDPSTSISVGVDTEITTNAVATPASIFNCTEPFQIARTDRGNYLNGYASNVFLTSAQQSDSIMNNLLEQSRVMYGREG